MRWWQSQTLQSPMAMLRITVSILKAMEGLKQVTKVQEGWGRWGTVAKWRGESVKRP